jgi:alpha-galactosidase
LMFGGNLPDNDAFTESLLTNKEVLDVLQYSRDNREVFRNENGVAWLASDTRTGDYWLAMFNPSDSSRIVKTSAASLGLKKDMAIRDCWKRKDIGEMQDSITATIPPHGAVLYRLSSVKR